MVAESTLAAVVALVVTASLPFYLYGAWIILDAEVVTWRRLRRHLRYVVVGLVLTTVPVVGWMAPRLVAEPTGFTAVHAFVGLQAYAFLVFALTGIFHIFRVKRRHDLYREPDPDVALDDLHEKMPHWRKRLRAGVAGYVVLWLVAWLLGVGWYVSRYL